VGHIIHSYSVRLNLIHILQNISPLVIPHRINCSSLYKTSSLCTKYKGIV
jgi:hypothetical protein